MRRSRPPGRRGLYDPAYEHDACGVGFVVNVKGVASHTIIEQGLQILANLTHRGACGCDPLTGDGAGILAQMPDAFLRKVTADLEITLPERGEYGVGMVFLPERVDERNECLELFEKIVREEGQRLLGWRRVPVDASKCGQLARDCMPEIRQIFIARGRNTPDAAALERKLYVIRKRVEHAVRESGLRDSESFYVPSLSCNTINYKGLLLPDQIPQFYRDLTDPDFASALALVHQRFSTNTFPSWDRAHPYRYVAHNGEINTLRGNINWMHARESMFASPRFGDDMEKLFPIIAPGGSDSAGFDNALELLVHTGRPLSHAVMMMIPEAWQKHEGMSEEKRAFYRYHACLAEAWDGPASIAFSDGKVIGAVLDRNGLRPSRYVVTKDGLVVMASEVGVLDIAPENVLAKGRLQPGRMFLVDTEAGRIVADEELKDAIARRQPYGAWLADNLTRLDDLPEAALEPAFDDETLLTRQQAFGYTNEDLKLLMAPMALNGQEAVGSMGTDTPLAVLSNKAQLLFNYFKQLFAQVTNPPIDPIREELVMSLRATIGAEENLFDETPAHCRQLELEEPVIGNGDLAKIKALQRDKLKVVTIPALYRVRDGGAGLEKALAVLCWEAEAAIANGATLLVLTDRGMDAENAPIPSLLATAAVHHQLIRERQPHPLRPGDRVRRAPRGDALRAPRRLRSRRDQSLSRDRARCAIWSATASSRVSPRTRPSRTT